MRIPRAIWAGAMTLSMAAVSHASFNYFDPTDTAHVPDRLSKIGVFQDIAGKRMTPEAVPFEINAPLWSDGAVKKRWIILRPGRSIPYDDTTDFFDYPDSTVFVKTFLLEKVEGDSSTRVYWETRLLVKKLDPANTGDEILADWYGFSFRWNAAQTEAFLTSRDSYESFDTVFSYVDAHGRQTYKKWNFPAREKCWYCHFKGRAPTETGSMRTGRAVMGFYPAQLKRPSASGDANQILDFFKRGVFTGTPPGPADLARRFKNIHDPIPAGLSPENRFRVIDTLARSYLAANCSGCHSTRNGNILNCPIPPNFDFHNLRPAMELAGQPLVQSFNLADTTTYDSLSEPDGRFKYLLTLSQFGRDTRSGTWDMAFPPGHPDSVRPVMLYPGYASLSGILFRAWVRNSPQADSGNAFRALMRRTSPVNEFPLDSAEAARRLRLVFSAPWGTRAWEDSLARHGFNHDSLLLRYTDGYRADASQMPPLSTFQADTAALTLLGEWVKNYRSLPNSGVKGRRLPGSTGPVLRNRILVVPADWPGRPAMLDIRGRLHALKPLGRGAYALPSSARPGIYFFRVGARHFKLSTL